MKNILCYLVLLFVATVIGLILGYFRYGDTDSMLILVIIFDTIVTIGWVPQCILDYIISNRRFKNKEHHLATYIIQYFRIKLNDFELVNQIKLENITKVEKGNDGQIVFWFSNENQCIIGTKNFDAVTIFKEV